MQTFIEKLPNLYQEHGPTSIEKFWANFYSRSRAQTSIEVGPRWTAIDFSVPSRGPPKEFREHPDGRRQPSTDANQQLW